MLIWIELSSLPDSRISESYHDAISESMSFLCSGICIFLCCAITAFLCRVICGPGSKEHHVMIVNCHLSLIVTFRWLSPFNITVMVVSNMTCCLCLRLCVCHGVCQIMFTCEGQLWTRHLNGFRKNTRTFSFFDRDSVVRVHVSLWCDRCLLITKTLESPQSL